jgi:hypothetical protein
MPARKQTPENATISIDPKRLGIILSIIIALSGAVYKTYTVTTGYLDTLATKVEVKQSEINSSIELVTVTMMGYEDELIGYDFLIETNKATELDRVARNHVERRIQTLKEKLNRLESRSAELQDIQSGSDVVN